MYSVYIFFIGLYYKKNAVLVYSIDVNVVYVVTSFIIYSYHMMQYDIVSRIPFAINNNNHNHHITVIDE